VNPITAKKRCAVYTRKSTNEGLDQEYNSLEAQRDAGLAYIASQRHEGWIAVNDGYDDGGYSGGNVDRPALKRLLADIEAGRVDIIVVYKIDRLTRSLVGVFLYGATARVHGIAGDTPSGLPAFPAAVGVNAADDLQPLTGGSTSVLPSPGANIGVNADCELMRLNSPASERWSEPGVYDRHFRAIPSGRKNIHFSGVGVIAGTVKEKGIPDQPLERRVQLISENTRLLVAETWSDANGDYRFEVIDPTQRYTVVSYDHKHLYRAVIADNLQPQLMP
jgi:hypothetical protein